MAVAYDQNTIVQYRRPRGAAFVILTGRIGCKIRQRVHSIKQTWPRAQVLSSASVVWILNPTFLRYLTVFLRNHDPSCLFVCVSMRHCDGRNKKDMELHNCEWGMDFRKKMLELILTGRCNSGDAGFFGLDLHSMRKTSVVLKI